MNFIVLTNIHFPNNVFQFSLSLVIAYQREIHMVDPSLVTNSMHITRKENWKIKKVMYHYYQAPPQKIQLSSTLILTLKWTYY